MGKSDPETGIGVFCFRGPLIQQIYLKSVLTSLNVYDDGIMIKYSSH